jgi:hypothetical protein
MQEVGHKENSEFYDLTDRENPEFRVSGLNSRIAMFCPKVPETELIHGVHSINGEW